jgi:3-methyladenine DNA glycosylase/8-oxoguanine DNA glycosylase
MADVPTPTIVPLAFAGPLDWSTMLGYFAAAVDKGEVVLDGSRPLDSLMAEICAIRGLGPWTASYIALRLGEPDAFPVADLGLRRAVRPEDPLTTAELAERAEAWRPFRAQAAVRLWLSEAA